MQAAIPFWQYGGGGALAVSVSITNLDGYKTCGAACTVRTGDNSGGPATVTAVPTGGTPPYTYQWLEDGGPSGASIQSATAATTLFYKNFASPGSLTGNFYCRVTDATMATADSGNVEVILEMST